MEKVISGNVRSWKWFGKERKFGEVTLPYSEASELFQPIVYKGQTGRGEQRDICKPHLAKLQAAMKNGEYTPTPISVGLSKKHREALSLPPGETQTFSITVSDTDPLPNTDGGHRMESINSIIKGLKEQLKIAKTDDEKKVIEQLIQEGYNLPVTATIYLDGDTQQDFINLQAGRPVDAAHLFTLKVQKKVLSDPSFKLAIDTAKELDSAEGNFQKIIRFDSREDKKSLVKKLPVSTLCSKGSSDLSTSLIGLAKVALAGGKEWNGAKLASVVNAVYAALKEKAPGLLEEGKVLTPVREGGTKGSATMILGVSACVLSRLVKTGDATLLTLPSLAEDAAVAASKTLDVKVNGGFAGATKRALIGKFAKEFFGDTTENTHEGLPVDLLRTLSASAFGVSSLPKEPKPTKVAKAKKNLPDVDGPLPASEEAAEDEVSSETFADLSTNQENAVEDDELVGAAVGESNAAPWEQELQG